VATTLRRLVQHASCNDAADQYFQFLTDLEQRLRPLGSEERETLLQLKAEELKTKGEPFDGEFYIWDYRYYDRLYLEKTLSLDDALIKEYFPVSVVVPAILEIYQNLLGVRFQKVNDTQAWHPDVQVFAVWAADANDESNFVGYCYLDLFPRGTLSLLSRRPYYCS
jgi:Zn-dependent oligopeptidase